MASLNDRLPKAGRAPWPMDAGAQRVALNRRVYAAQVEGIEPVLQLPAPKADDLYVRIGPAKMEPFKLADFAFMNEPIFDMGKAMQVQRDMLERNIMRDPWEARRMEMDMRRGGIGGPCRAGCGCNQCQEQEARRRGPSFDTIGRRETLAPTQDEVQAARDDMDAVIPAIKRLFAMYPEVSTYANDQPAFRHVEQLLKSLGWDYLGKGYFSAAWGKGGLAFKVSFKKEDGGGAYAAWARANQGLPGVPVIHRIKGIGSYYCVLMDKLKAFSEHGMGSDPEHVREFNDCRDQCSTMRRGVPKTAIGHTMSLIYDFFRGSSEFDLHSGNVMVTRDGQLVITDPLSRSTQRGSGYDD